MQVFCSCAMPRTGLRSSGSAVCAAHTTEGHARIFCSVAPRISDFCLKGKHSRNRPVQRLTRFRVHLVVLLAALLKAAPLLGLQLLVLAAVVGPVVQNSKS